MIRSFRIICMLTFVIASSFSATAKGGKNPKKEPKDSISIALERELVFADSVRDAMKWQTGKIILPKGVIQLNIPEGFKFLNAEQSRFVLHDVWGNPPSLKVLGMIFPAENDPYTDSSFVFVVSYEEDGYVKDEDADKIDYNELIKNIKSGEETENKERAKQGYEPIHLIGWAQPPFYDKNRKVLHWAKEFQFGELGSHTLNYDVRVLGRKGVLSLNAVADMSQLGLVKSNIDAILKMPEFTKGNKYSDFNSNTDKVAEYGLGALVAGGVLAKTGVLAVIGKFFLAAWKFILLGAVALWGGIKKLLGMKKKEDDLA